MRRGKLHYNADRWWAYCADRMGWQVGHWINGATPVAPGMNSEAGAPARDKRAMHWSVEGKSGLQPATTHIHRQIPTINGNAADATQANTHPSRVCADAAAPTPSVWRRRK